MTCQLRVMMRSICWGVVPIVVALVLVLVYVVYGYLKLKQETLTNIDAEVFWQTIHPGLGVSLLPSEQQYVHYCGSKQDHDPRVIPALWLNFISSQSEESVHGPFFNISVPFLWDSYLGISPDSCSNFNCSVLLLLVLLDSENHTSCVHIPQFEITGPLDSPFSAEIRKCIGANYMYHRQEIPSKAVLLGLGPESELKPRVLVIDLTKMGREGVEFMESKYLRTFPEAKGISILQQLKRAKELWSLSVSEEGIGKSVYTLTEEDFDPVSQASIYYKNGSFLSFENTPDDLHASKYFHEAELSDTHVGFHHDWRFFKKHDFSVYERKVILHRLSKAWLRFANSAGLKTWLAHGSLLGWYWNGMNLPWDQDLDVQMPYKSIVFLAEQYNQTLVVDLTNDPDIAGVYLYFIDVNPCYKLRTHDSRENVVDARFIDTDTGMYVDITALAISDEIHISNPGEKTSHRLHQVFNADYNNVVKSADLGTGYTSLKDLHRRLTAEETQAWKHRHLYNCKGMHFYTLSELGPLLKTSFEGEVAYVPRDFKAILSREYPRGLTARCYENWVYRPYFGVWTPLSKCPNDLYGDQCNDRDMILEDQYTKSYRLKRGHWQLSIKPSPRVDPFIIRRNHALMSAPKP